MVIIIKNALKYGGAFVLGSGVGVGVSKSDEIATSANLLKVSIIGLGVYLIAKKLKG